MDIKTSGIDCFPRQLALHPQIFLMSPRHHRPWSVQLVTGLPPAPRCVHSSLTLLPVRVIQRSVPGVVDQQRDRSRR